MEIGDLLNLFDEYYQAINIKKFDIESPNGYHFVYIGTIESLRNSRYLQSEIKSISIYNNKLSILIDE